jgi:hypothetical protein
MKRGSRFPFSRFLPAAAAISLALASILSWAQDDDPPQQAGRLSIVNGNVSIQPAGAQDWGQAYLNYPLGPGDRIFTDSDGRAEIQVGRTYVRVGPNSDVTFVDFSNDAITFGAAQGALHVRTRGLWQGQSLYVQTPSGSSTVTGPADFKVEVYPDQQTAIFTNYSGDVYISGANDFGMDTGPGQALELVGTNPVYPQWLQPGDQDDLDRWSERRDQQITQATSYRYVSPDAPGAEELDAYGQWTPATEYGDMWFPTVQSGWAPYHNGHWVNREPWGWVWVEDEPWGYAPFHYGRWVSYRGRWGWIPGPREEHAVWSPALVVFAGGIGGGGVSAWFPLGPGEAYRPWYRCSPRYVDQVNITNIRETNIVHVQKTYVNVVNVTNVNNITYVNRTTAVTAMRQQDFAAGRSVSQSAVRVDPREMAQARVLERPQVAPTREAVINRPAARPVPVAVQRPTLINARGLAVSAQPRAQASSPPVKTAPAPPALPNRTVVAPPPNVRMTQTARQALQNAPRSVAQPARPGQPPAQAPAPGRPVAAPPAPGQQPAPISPNQPRPAPVPPASARPPAQPTPQAPSRSTERPVPTPQPAPPQQPQERPAPDPPPQQPPRPTYQQPGPPPNRPPDRPTYQQPGPPPNRPTERPAPPPQQSQPPQRPVERPAPPPQAQPRPEPRPEAPQQRAAPPPPQPRPNVEPRPAPRQQPPPPPPQDRNRRPDDKDKTKPQN